MIRAASLLAALLLAGPAVAQPASPTLGGIVDRGTVRLAVADDAPPFSWVGLDGKQDGYAVELCRRVAADVANTLGWELVAADAPERPRTVRLDLLPVPVSAEAAAVADGTADIGCSATPGADPRVGASPPAAVSGTRLLVARLGDISSVRDLPGRTVVVVTGTRAADTLARAVAPLSPPVHIATVPSPGDGYELLATGAADALAGDDLLLAGLLATRTDGPSFTIVGRPLDQAAPALAIPAGDPAFAAMVRQSFDRMAANGTLQRSYDRWFTTPVPGGAALDRPRTRAWAATVTPRGPPGR